MTYGEQDTPNHKWQRRQLVSKNSRCAFGAGMGVFPRADEGDCLDCPDYEAGSADLDTEAKRRLIGNKRERRDDQHGQECEESLDGP